MAQPERTHQRSVRGLLAALAPLVLVVLVVGAVAGQCSFSPGRPDTGDAVTPVVDLGVELPRLARSVPFPVREPRLPDAWQANSADLDRVGPGDGAPLAVRVGWITQQGAYLRLSQSSASEADLVAFETRHPRRADGTVRVQGVPWRTYPAERGERAWVADLGEARLLVTGSAPDQDLRVLAAAAQAAPPLTG